MGDITEDALGGKRGKINSKAKGNRAELQAAKFMHKWTGIVFARTPGSGALRWVNMSAICGDLTIQDQSINFPFTIEVKHYKSVDISLKRKNSKVFTFWKQAKTDAERAGKIPMLLVRTNGMPAGEFIVYVKEVIMLVPNIKMIKGGGLVGFNSTELLDKWEFSIFAQYQNK